MFKHIIIIVIFFSFILMQACRRKTIPEVTHTATPPSSTKVADSIAIAAAKAKMGYKTPVKTPVPKSIVVNDAAAKKTVNNRYYYDLEGKRYWRNKKDGKYYLYYKGMFDNKDFQ